MAKKKKKLTQNPSFRKLSVIYPFAMFGTPAVQKN